MSLATSRHATQFAMRFDAFQLAANCGRSTRRLFGAPPASLGLPKGRWGEITFAATPGCEAGPLLLEEQPARRARMIVAASVAATIDIARLDLLFTIEEKLHFLTRDDRTRLREASHRDPSA